MLATIEYNSTISSPDHLPAADKVRQYSFTCPNAYIVSDRKGPPLESSPTFKFRIAFIHYTSTSK